MNHNVGLLDVYTTNFFLHVHHDFGYYFFMGKFWLFFSKMLVGEIKWIMDLPIKLSFWVWAAAESTQWCCLETLLRPTGWWSWGNDEVGESAKNGLWWGGGGAGHNSSLKKLKAECENGGNMIKMCVCYSLAHTHRHWCEQLISQFYSPNDNRKMSKYVREVNKNEMNYCSALTEVKFFNTSAECTLREMQTHPLMMKSTTT